MITLLRFLLRLIYSFRAYNTGVLDTPGPVLLLPNHVSWWDWLLIGVCLGDDWRFVTSSTTAQTTWLHKRIMVNRRTFPVDMGSPYAVKHMAEYLQKGGRLVLFPEGRISTTGSLMKLFDGTGFLIHRTKAKVITAYLRGAERLPFSRNSDRKQWFPRISAHFSPLQNVPSVEGVSNTEARKRLTNWLREAMVEQRFQAEMESGPKTILEAVEATARRRPWHRVLQDATLTELSYHRLMTGADALSSVWPSLLDQTQRRVGVLLPNVNAMPIALLSLWAAGKTPAILNYSTGTASLLNCCRLAGLKQIISSKNFLSRAKLDLEPLKATGVEVLFLEDIRTRISSGEKAISYLRQWVKPGFSHRNTAKASDTAVVLFTSGSEGEPKGVELTHRNVLANIRQMQSVIDLTERDRFFNALPLFHSFGLTIGTLLPLVHGSFVVLYLSPLHYRVVPSAFYNLNCTVLFGTNTFLMGYARKAHPYDFRTLRYVYAAAEKLQESTSLIWMRKFGVRVLEGYGATECSPCVAANLPMRPQFGSVGEFLPGIEYRLEPVEGVGSPSDNAGRLFVRGPNIMHGYLNPEANSKFLALGGWYDTGDIVRVDQAGFIYILGRLKRFAKVSGEMVSLGAVEEAIANSFPQYGPKFSFAVIIRPDTLKGEKLVAVTTESKLTMDEVREAIRSRGLSNLAVPKELMVIHSMPLLGTGKVNYRALEQEFANGRP
jgi:acyl-[acyl-carrier-protein]-phospholipid O-acyltransferase/long-chain-fatty-acid--[acyl-carrier-protein] ligase